MAKGWKALEERFGGGNRPHMLRWLLIAAGVGAIFMILQSFLTVEEVDPYRTDPAALYANGAGGEPASDLPAFQSNAKDSKFAAYEAIYENSLKEILEKIVGVGQVDVLVTIDSTEEIIAERHMNENHQETNERDTEGATRHVKQTTRNGEIVLYTVDGNQVPLVRKTIKPTIRGVFIVAEGAEHAAVKKMILEAVERGVGVPAHRISIAPRKR